MVKMGLDNTEDGDDERNTVGEVGEHEHNLRVAESGAEACVWLTFFEAAFIMVGQPTPWLASILVFILVYS